MSNYSPQPHSTGLSDSNYIYFAYLGTFKKRKQRECLYTPMKSRGLNAVKIISCVVENVSTVLHPLVQN